MLNPSCTSADSFRVIVMRISYLMYLGRFLGISVSALWLLSAPTVFASDSEETAIIDLRQNPSFIEKAYGYVEQYMTIVRRHREHRKHDHIIDDTGDEIIGIHQPESEAGKNFYLILGDDQTLLFAKEIMGFAAYENDIPVFLSVGQSSTDIYAVYIRLHNSGHFLKLTVSLGLDDGAMVLDPNRLILAADGFHPARQDDLFVHASLGPIEEAQAQPILRLGPCAGSFWIPGT